MRWSPQHTPNSTRPWPDPTRPDPNPTRSPARPEPDPTQTRPEPDPSPTRTRPEARPDPSPTRPERTCHQVWHHLGRGPIHPAKFMGCVWVHRAPPANSGGAVPQQLMPALAGRSARHFGMSSKHWARQGGDNPAISRLTLGYKRAKPIVSLS